MSTTAQDVISPRRLPRSVAALVVAVCSCLFVVAGTNAQPASAKIDTLYLERMLKTVPKSAGGAATVVGGGLTAGGLATTAAAAVAGYFVFDASFDATTAALEWAFGDPETSSMTGGPLETSVSAPSVTAPGTSITGLTLLADWTTGTASTGNLVNFTTSPSGTVAAGGSGTFTATFTGAANAATDICRYTNGSSCHASQYRLVMWAFPGTCNGGYEYYCGAGYSQGMNGQAFTITPMPTTIPNGQTYTWNLTSPGATTARVQLYAERIALTPVAQSAPAPLHKWRSVTHCQGGSSVTVTGTTAFRERDETLPPIVPASCPEGLPTGLEVYEGDADGVGGPQRVDWEAPPAQPYPECLPGGAQAPCDFTLLKITNQGYVDCVGDNVDCTGYDPQTSTNSEYLCLWGTYTLPLDDCEPLDALQEVPGPDPQAPAEPIPGTIGTGDPVHNPDGSVTVKQTQTMPDGTTRTVTTTTWPDGSRTIVTQPLDPQGEPTGAPAVVNLPAPGTGSEPGTEGETAGCMGSWTWNPVAWVYRPVKCALQWAFVPSAGALQAEFAEVDTAWDASGPGALTQGLNDLAAPILTMDENIPTDCLGPEYTVPLPASRSFSMHPLSTCGELTQLILGIVYPLETALIYLGGFLLGLRIVTRPFGMDTPGTTEAASA